MNANFDEEVAPWDRKEEEEIQIISPPPAAINFEKLISSRPAPAEMIMPGFLVGTVGTVIAPGATGKSFFSLELALAVAGGPDLTGLATGEDSERSIIRGGKVLILSAEDPRIITEHRFYGSSLLHMGNRVKMGNKF